MGYMCVYLHICVCAWMNTTIYIYIYIYIYIDTHIVSESYQEGNAQLY